MDGGTGRLNRAVDRTETADRDRRGCRGLLLSAARSAACTIVGTASKPRTTRWWALRFSCTGAFGRYSARLPGGVAEWLKAHAWNACIRETVSGVRIPLPPPSSLGVWVHESTAIQNGRPWRPFRLASEPKTPLGEANSGQLDPFSQVAFRGLRMHVRRATTLRDRGSAAHRRTTT